MELIFTHNEGKVHEIQNIVGDNIKILSLTDIGYLEEIPETGSTFNENAFVKLIQYIKYIENLFLQMTLTRSELEWQTRCYSQI